ncbi:hypothetical protein B0H10DRAFT_2441434 [Mycena sp. CBHHK59/15]|nr:hypothetical protein B0H10DRAFT_2441434 [Mycena sp. CBHHK59/15]
MCVRESAVYLGPDSLLRACWPPNCRGVTPSVFDGGGYRILLVAERTCTRILAKTPLSRRRVNRPRKRSDHAHEAEDGALATEHDREDAAKAAGANSRLAQLPLVPAHPLLLLLGTGVLDKHVLRSGTRAKLHELRGREYAPRAACAAAGVCVQLEEGDGVQERNSEQMRMTCVRDVPLPSPLSPLPPSSFAGASARRRGARALAFVGRRRLLGLSEERGARARRAAAQQRELHNERTRSAR